MRVLSFGLSLSIVAFAGLSAHAEKVDFNRDIRPILSDKCFYCHGPDSKTREAGLRLDQRDGAIAELESGTHAITPGKPDESELIARIFHEEADMRMPPEDSHRVLTDGEKKLLRQWIAEGAEYQDHWAFRPLARPAPPEVRQGAWIRNPIDHFILARLEREGLTPAAEADRRTLARRLSFDLTGLPPAPADVEAFVNDAAPDAYEKLVDRLLAKPQFGERMAMYWLDVVRYADTVGYHGDQERQVWLYRDYVIDAFNQNKPFDQFTIEQIAGDLLPNATREQKVASGYNHLLQVTREGGAQAKEYTAIYAADRVRNTSTAWLGLTVGCAQCHDHKFDPIKAKDFYSFAAFFADVQEVAVGEQVHTAMPTAEQTARGEQLTARIAELKKQLDTPTPALAAAQATWEQTAAAGPSSWRRLKPTQMISENGATLSLQADGSILAGGPSPDIDTLTIEAPIETPRIAGLQLEALLHDSLPQKTSSRSPNGNFVLSEVTVEVRAPGQEAPAPVKLAAAEADYSQSGFEIAKAIDGNLETGWAVDGHVADRRGDRTVVLTFAEPRDLPPGATLVIHLKCHSVHKQHVIGCFRLSASEAAPASLKNAEFPRPIAGILATSAAQRTAGQQAQLAAYYRSIAPLLQPVREEIAKIEAEQKQLLATFPKTVVTVALARPREVRLLPRGNWMDDSGPVMQPEVPEFFGKLASGEQRASRLDLARWLVSRENPLTARAMVNRYWMLLFGQGLARNTDDLGSQGAWPSHPMLIDWLASEYVEKGWNTKQLLKTIVLSAAYRQNSVITPELQAKDPYNYLLARQGRFRLPAEMVRDNALSISGLLVDKIGGRSARPYQPPGYYRQLNFPPREYQVDSGEMQYRRGLYTHWQRTFLHPMMQAFDAPTREECTAQRSRSNTPLASLVLLNDPTFVEAARSFAERLIREGGSAPEDRIRFAYQQALGRTPAAEELATLVELYEKHRGQYQADAAAAGKLISIGQKQPPQDLAADELAAWTSVARTILILHETITRS